LERWTREDNELALAFFLKASQVEKEFALAYIGLARCYVQKVEQGWDLNEKWLDKAEELLGRVEKTSREIPEFYSVQAGIHLLRTSCFNRNTLEISYSHIQQGLELFPNDPALNMLAGEYHFLSFGNTGKESDYGQALSFKEVGYWLNPYSLNNIKYAVLLMLKGDYPGALRICDQIIKHDDSRLSSLLLGEIYYFSGRLDESAAVFDLFQTPLDLKLTALLNLGMIHARRGDHEQTQDILDLIFMLSPKETSSGYRDLKLASIHFGLKEDKHGYIKLEACFSSHQIKYRRYTFLKYIELDPNFTDYKNSSQFKSITQPD